MTFNFMKYFILLMIILIPFISADCNESQIDINSASLEELDELSGIGPVYAGRIVENRPFESVEDLVKVSGIGEKTLEKIKTQGLACVDSEKETVEEPSVTDKRVGEENVEEEVLDNPVETDKKDEIVLNSKPEIISLNSEVVEEKDNLVYISKNAQVVNYLPYGFAVFLIFIIGVLIWERF